MLYNMWLILKSCFTKPFQESIIYDGKIWTKKEFYDTYVVINERVIPLKNTPITIVDNRIEITGHLSK